MADEQGVKETPPAPSALEEAIASSPEVVEEAQQQGQAQTPTAEQGTEPVVKPQEEGRIPYSRFKEKVDEANFYKELLSRQPQPQQLQQPTQPQNPYANMSPEEERFFRMIDDRATKIAEAKLNEIRPVIDMGRMEIAQTKVAQFRVAHPDIRPNSPEEAEIAQRISSGYLPDDAYWSVMGPRGIRVAQEQTKQQVKQQMEAKRQANVGATSGVNSQVVSPKKETFRETAARLLDLATQGKL